MIHKEAPIIRVNWPSIIRTVHYQNHPSSWPVIIRTIHSDIFRLSPIKTNKLKSILKVHAKNRDLDSVSIWNRTSNCIYLENPFKPVMRFNSIKSHSKETIFDSFEFDNQLCQAASKEIISKMNSNHVTSMTCFESSGRLTRWKNWRLWNIFEINEGQRWNSPSAASFEFEIIFANCWKRKSS